MPVVFSSGYSLPPGDQPLTHARILHGGNAISGTPGASSTDASEIYSAASPANDFLFEKWKAAGTLASWSLTPTTPAEISCCAIAASNIFRDGLEFAVQVDTGAGWQNVVSETVVSEDGPILAIFPPVTVLAAQVFFPATNPAPPELGFVRFGSPLQMPARTAYPNRAPFALARAPTLTVNRSVKGTPLAAHIESMGQPLSFSWAHLPEDFTTTQLAQFLEALDTGLFIIAERPASHPRDVALCWVSGSRPIPRATGEADLHQLTLSVEGAIDA